MKRLLSLLIIFAVMSWSALGAAPARPGQRSEVEESRRTFNLAPGAVVSVQNTSGRITVTGWNQNHAEVQIVKRAHRNPEDLNRVSIEITDTPLRLDIRTIYERYRNLSVEVEYTLKVPLNTNLDAVRSTSGDVFVTGINGNAVAASTSGDVIVRGIGGFARINSTSGDVEGDQIKGRVDAASTSGTIRLRDTGAASLRATSGDLTALNAAGRVEMETSSGNITAEHLRGDLFGRTSSGNVRALDIDGSVKVSSKSGEVLVDRVSRMVTASSISGSVQIRGGADLIEAYSTSDDVIIRGARGRIEAGSTSGNVRLEEIDSSQVNLKSTSGDIYYAGSLTERGSYDFESLSGSVVVVFPRNNCGFSLTAKTYSGEIETDFEIKVSGPFSSAEGSRRLEGISGNGCARVKASSFSGSVLLRSADNPRGQNRRK